MIGGYFTHGPLAGEFSFVSYAQIPKSTAKTARKTLAEQAAKHGVEEDALGVIDSDVLLAFVWQLAGRPPEAPADWQRARPLEVWLDNYSVHKSQRVKDELPQLEAAKIRLCYLPAYCPDLSGIEPIWQDVKYRGMRTRSHKSVGELKAAVDVALARKAIELRESAKSLVGTA